MLAEELFPETQALGTKSIWQLIMCIKFNLNKSGTIQSLYLKGESVAISGSLFESICGAFLQKSDFINAP